MNNRARFDVLVCSRPCGYWRRYRFAVSVFLQVHFCRTLKPAVRPEPRTQNGMAPDLSQCESVGVTLKKELRKTSSR